MTIGQEDYIEQLTRMTLGSGGALSLEYLIESPFDHVNRVNETMKKFAEDVKRGK